MLFGAIKLGRPEKKESLVVSSLATDPELLEDRRLDEREDRLGLG